MKKNRKNGIPSRYILIGLTVLFLGIIAITYKIDFSGNAGNSVIGYIFVPIQKGINSIGTMFYNITDNFRNMEDVKAENDALKKKVDELTTQNNSLMLEHYEYIRLLELLKLDELYSDYDKVAARIIGKDPGNWFNSFTIDKGTNDGIQIDMNVVAGSGLVGIVYDVGANWAKVRSIIDDSSNVYSMNLNTTDLCIIAGDLQSMNKNQTIVFKDMSDSNGDVKEGDPMVTSNISSKFLPGLLIGYLTNIKKDSNNISLSGEITPVVDFEHLEEVLVITKLK